MLRVTRRRRRRAARASARGRASRRRARRSYDPPMGETMTSSMPCRSASARTLGRGIRGIRDDPALLHRRDDLVADRSRRGAASASSTVSSGRIGRLVRSRAIERSCGSARARASSTVGATDAFTVRNVSGAGCASLGGVLGAVQLERPLEALAREVVREHVRQAERRGELGRVVARSEQPQRRDIRRRRRRRDRVLAPAREPQRRAVGRQQRQDVGDVVGEPVDVGGRSRDAQQLRDHRVAAGRPPDAEVDAARRERLERRELLGHDERGVVRQHDAARADADALGLRRDRRDQHGRRRRGDGRHVVVLGEPVARVAEPVGELREANGCRDRLRCSSGRCARERGRVPRVAAQCVIARRQPARGIRYSGRAPRDRRRSTADAAASDAGYP